MNDMSPQAWLRQGAPQLSPNPSGVPMHAYAEVPNTGAMTATDLELARLSIGTVIEVCGSQAVMQFDVQALDRFTTASDHSLVMAGQMGSQIKARVGSIWIMGNLRSLRCDFSRGGALIGEVDFLGEGDEERLTGRIYNFRRGVTRYPGPGSDIYAVTTSDLREIFTADERAHIEIGTVFPTSDVRAALYIDALLGKHFALVGSTGTGKSTSAALILHRICELAPQGHIVMIDPHGEYSSAFKGNGALFDVSNLDLPYWLMNFEEHCEVIITSTGADRSMDADILAKCLLNARSKNRMAAGLTKITVDTPVPYLLSDLLAAITQEMGKLDKPISSVPYMRLKTKIEELRADPRFTFMFSGMLVSDSMASFISRIFRLPTNGKPISIIDVSGVPSEVTSVVVSTLSRLVFDYAIWSRGEDQRPVLLVCEEAHRYVPAERNAHKSSVGKILGRIAKEGRKYGVSLGLITQRPSDLAEGILSQCGTIIAMRLNNDRDQAFVRAAMPEGARGFLDSIPALRNRECIICGEGVTIPVRIRLDALDPHRRPASDDLLFSQLWQQAGGDEDRLDRIIHRWRTQSQ